MSYHDDVVCLAERQEVRGGECLLAFVALDTSLFLMPG